LLYGRAEISVKIWHYENYIANCSRRENESQITGFTGFSIMGKIIDSKIMGKENGAHRSAATNPAVIDNRYSHSENDSAIHDSVQILGSGINNAQNLF
jgi:hypothetical protein